jgi:hypothetical protein
MISGINVKPNHPPKNNKIFKVDIKIIFEYSPKKNRANNIPEYSILYPATISASASGKSKGARFVSAKDDIKKIMARGKNGIINHIVFSCVKTISKKFKDFVIYNIGRRIKLNEIS